VFHPASSVFDSIPLCVRIHPGHPGPPPRPELYQTKLRPREHHRRHTRALPASHASSWTGSETQRGEHGQSRRRPGDSPCARRTSPDRFVSHYSSMISVHVTTVPDRRRFGAAPVATAPPDVLRAAPLRERWGSRLLAATPTKTDRDTRQRWKRALEIGMSRVRASRRREPVSAALAEQ